MSYIDFGYIDNPANGLGIIRARTLIGNLRLWDFPRSERALETIHQEIGVEPIPGLYMLFDEHGEKRVYIGQSENLKARIISHIRSPDDKIKGWNRAIIINDGRSAVQSDLNDENIRLSLEYFLVQLFKLNRYKVLTTASRSPSISSTQKTLLDVFKQEITILLSRKSKINKFFTERGDDEVHNDEVRKTLIRKGFSISKWGKVEAIVNGKLTFLRPGSPKSIGWQVTFRGAKPDSFKSRLQEGDGFLLVPRGPILLIPLSDVAELIRKVDNQAFERDTIDIFVRFNDNNIVLHYKREELDVTIYALDKYP